MMLTPEFPRIPLQDIAIDFVGPLKSSGHYDMLMSCTCRLSGFTRLIPTLQKDTAEKTALRFFTGWLALFGSPTTIISNRDKAQSMVVAVLESTHGTHRHPLPSLLSIPPTRGRPK
jgi:hypothetical protein